jgi:DNA polymerase-3 subunit beta
MPTTIDRKQLAEVLKVAAPVAARSRHLPILSCVRFTLWGETVEAQASDGDLSVTTYGGTGGTMTAPDMLSIVNARLLAHFVANAHDDITFEEVDGRLQVTSGGSTLTLRTMRPDDWPTIKGAVDNMVQLPAGIGTILYAASKDNARPILTGVGFKDGWACCTDSYRLAAIRIDGMPDCLVPAHVIELALKQGPDVTMTVSDNLVSLTVGATIYNSRLIFGEFPTWQRLCDQPGSNVLEVDRDDLLDALERVSPLVHMMQPVMFTDGVTLSAKTVDVGEATEQLAGIYDLDTPLGLNPSFLADMAKAAPAGPFRLQLNGIIKPAVHGSLESGAISLLMPVRVS